jgi:hypothetical protein
MICEQWSKKVHIQIFISEYLKLKEKGGLRPSSLSRRTVWPDLEDHPPVRRGPSTRVEGARRGTGCSGSIFGPSAMGSRTVRAPRGPSAKASRTIRVSHTQVGPRSWVVSQACNFSSSQPAKSPLPHLSLALSQRKEPPWGFGLGHSPDRLSTSTDSPRGSPPCHPGIFSINSLSHSLGFWARRWLGFDDVI